MNVFLFFFSFFDLPQNFLTFPQVMDLNLIWFCGLYTTPWWMSSCQRKLLPYRTLCCYTQVPRCTLILFNVYTSVVWWHREGTTLTLPYFFFFFFAHEDFRFCTKVLAVTWQRRTYQVVLTVNPDEWFGRKWWWELSWCHCYCYTQINKSLCVCVCVCNRPRANTRSRFCLCTFSDRLLLTLTAAANANRSALNGILHSCKKFFFFGRNVKLT